MTDLEKVSWYIAIIFMLSMLALVVAEKRLEYRMSQIRNEIIQSVERY
jgi:preprotein translocase subunit SecG